MKHSLLGWLVRVSLLLVLMVGIIHWSGVNVSGGASVDVLKWHPGGGTPRARVLVDRFRNNDLGVDGPLGDIGWYWPFSSFLDTFTGGDPTLRQDLRNTFQHYLSHNGLHPAVSQPSNHNLKLFTYLKPYEFNQPEFLNWLQTETGRTDFLEPKARRNNNYRGTLDSPLVSSVGSITQAKLKRTFGQVAVFEPNRLTLVVDNRFNPMRWYTAINQIHHHERGSLSVTIPSKSGKWEETATIFDQFLDGDRSHRVFLEYDITVSVKDRRNEFNEQSVWSIYDGVHPSNSEYLVGLTHWNAYFYGNEQPAQGRTISCVEGKQMNTFLENRLIPPYVQVALMVNWHSRNGIWRSSEFMIASKKQGVATYYPQAGVCNGQGFKPTINDTLNPYVSDGRSRGEVAWTRIPISLLKAPIFTRPSWLQENLDPIVHGGQHIGIPNGNWSQRLTGKIDLTNYYALSRAHTFFPGQRGFWVNQEVGFEITNPNEQHGIEWAGVILENNGMFETKITVNNFNIWTE